VRGIYFRNNQNTKNKRMSIRAYELLRLLFNIISIELLLFFFYFVLAGHKMSTMRRISSRRSALAKQPTSLHE
jgi:hypothetical protein